MTSNAVPPSVTPPSPFEWPNTIQIITGITKDSQATVTCTGHGFTVDDEFITQVMFQQVLGMIPINGLPGLITDVIDVDNFVVNINTTGFPAYVSGGIINTMTGEPPFEKVGSQWFNTPFQNIATTH